MPRDSGRRHPASVSDDQQRKDKTKPKADDLGGQEPCTLRSQGLGCFACAVHGDGSANADRGESAEFPLGIRSIEHIFH